MREELFKNCTLCPRKCNVNRLEGKRGYCGMDSTIRAARAALHMWEEPCISGKKGSGAVFFSGCGLRCCFCQNRDLSLIHIQMCIRDSAEPDRWYCTWLYLADTVKRSAFHVGTASSEVVCNKWFYWNDHSVVMAADWIYDDHLCCLLYTSRCV